MSGSTPVVDFVCHHYPEAIVDPARKEGAFWTHLGPIPYDPTVLEARLTEAGVDAAVLSMPGYMGTADADAAAEANDALLDVVTAHEPFYGLASLPTGAGGEVAAAELERCLETGLNGGAVETRPDGRALTDPAMEPLIELAADTGAPLLVHPQLDDSIAPDALDETYFYNAVYGREVALCVSLSNVIYEGLVDRYPDLTLVFHHFGGNVAAMHGRIDIHADADRWPFKPELLPQDEFDRRLAQLYVDSSGHGPNPHVHAAAVDRFPTSNILFATDTPFAAVRNAAPDDAAAERMLGGNALELLVNVD